MDSTIISGSTSSHSPLIYRKSSNTRRYFPSYYMNGDHTGFGLRLIAVGGLLRQCYVSYCHLPRQNCDTFAIPPAVRGQVEVSYSVFDHALYHFVVGGRLLFHFLVSSFSGVSILGFDEPNRCSIWGCKSQSKRVYRHNNRAQHDEYGSRSCDARYSHSILHEVELDLEITAQPDGSVYPWLNVGAAILYSSLKAGR